MNVSGWSGLTISRNRRAEGYYREVRGRGFEPRFLASKASVLPVRRPPNTGSEGGLRTHNHPVNSRTLYQLSYLAAINLCGGGGSCTRVRGLPFGLHPRRACSRPRHGRTETFYALRVDISLRLGATLRPHRPRLVTSSSRSSPALLTGSPALRRPRSCRSGDSHRRPKRGADIKVASYELAEWAAQDSNL